MGSSPCSGSKRQINKQAQPDNTQTNTNTNSNVEQQQQIVHQIAPERQFYNEEYCRKDLQWVLEKQKQDIQQNSHSAKISQNEDPQQKVPDKQQSLEQNQPSQLIESQKESERDNEVEGSVQEPIVNSIMSVAQISLRNSIVRKPICLFCNEAIHEEYLNLSCNHTIHNQCFTTLLEQQILKKSTIFSCICNVKISPTLISEQYILNQLFHRQLTVIKDNNTYTSCPNTGCDYFYKPSEKDRDFCPYCDDLYCF